MCPGPADGHDTAQLPNVAPGLPLQDSSPSRTPTDADDDSEATSSALLAISPDVFTDYDDDDDDGPPPSFPRFGDLPPELRLCIWEEALPAKARIHRVWIDDKGRWEYRRPGGIPAILQACGESRSVGRSRYELGLAPIQNGIFTVSKGEAEPPRGIYMDWDKDEVLMCHFSTSVFSFFCFLPLLLLFPSFPLSLALFFSVYCQKPPSNPACAFPSPLLKQ